MYRQVIEFIEKHVALRGEVQHGSLEMFKRTSNTRREGNTLDVITEHLDMLYGKFEHYFKLADIAPYGQVRNNFDLTAETSTSDLSLKEREELEDVMSDCILKLGFSEVPLDVF